MFSKTATISGDKENFYNTIAQALTADNKPDPNGCGRVKLLDWIRKRRPDLLPVARLIMGTPSFIRLVIAFSRFGHCLASLSSLSVTSNEACRLM